MMRSGALDPSRIYLNSHGRFPKGTVNEAERKTLKKEIADELGRLEFEGRRVVRRVFEADEIRTVTVRERPALAAS